MKKTIFAAALALCLLAGTSAFAQNAQHMKKDQPREKMTVEQMAQKKTDKMTEALKLNEKQSKQVYEYTLGQVKMMEAKRAEMMQNRMAEKDKMKAILTPEQYTQWEQMQGPKPGQGKSCCDKAKDCDKQKCDKSGKGDCKQSCDKSKGGKSAEKSTK